MPRQADPQEVVEVDPAPTIRTARGTEPTGPSPFAELAKVSQSIGRIGAWAERLQSDPHSLAALRPRAAVPPAADELPDISDLANLSPSGLPVAVDAKRARGSLDLLRTARAVAEWIGPLVAGEVAVISVEEERDSTSTAVVALSERCGSAEWSESGKGTDPDPLRAVTLAVIDAVVASDTVPVAALRRLALSGLSPLGVVSAPSAPVVRVGEGIRPDSLAGIASLAPAGTVVEVETTRAHFRAAHFGDVRLALEVGPDSALIDGWLECLGSQLKGR